MLVVAVWRVHVHDIGAAVAAARGYADVCVWLLCPPVADFLRVCRRVLQSVRDERSERRLGIWGKREDEPSARGVSERRFEFFV